MKGLTTISGGERNWRFSTLFIAPVRTLAHIFYLMMPQLTKTQIADAFQRIDTLYFNVSILYFFYSSSLSLILFQSLLVLFRLYCYFAG